MRHNFKITAFILLVTVSLGCVQPNDRPSDQPGDQPDLSSMSTTISPASPAVYPATLTEPTAGDSVLSAQLRVNNGQALLNAAEAARLGLYGGGIRRRVKCIDNTHIDIQPLGSVLVTVAGVWTAKAHTAMTTFDPTAAGALTASTRYWVYASLVAGVVTFTRATDAAGPPDDGLRYKASSTDYELVTTFITNAANNIVTYTQSDNRYTYTDRTSSGAVDGNCVLYEGTDDSGISVAYGYAVPTQAAEVTLLGFFVTSAATFNKTDVAVLGISNFCMRIVSSTSTYATNLDSCSIPYADGGQFYYKVTDLATDKLTVNVTGFTL